MKLTALLVAVVSSVMVQPASADIVLPNDASLSSNLQLWLRGDDLTALYAGGDSIATWVDASGQGHDAVALANSTDGAQPTPSPVTLDQPTFAIADVPALGIGSSSDVLMSAGNLFGATPTEFTIITVYETADSNNRPVGFGSYREGTTANNFNLAADGTIRKDNGFVAGPDDPSTFYTRSVVQDATTLTQYYNGVQNINTSAQTVSTDQFYLGDIRQNVNAIQQIAEVIVYDRALTAGERLSVENYISAKYYSNLYQRYEEGTAGAAVASGADNGPLDHSVNDHTSTAITSGSGPVFSSDVAVGTIPLTGSSNNLSLHFDRANSEYLQIADSADLSFGQSSAGAGDASAFTVEAWVKFDSLVTGNLDRQYIVHKKSDSGVGDNDVDYGIAFHNSAGNNLSLQLGNGSSNVNISSGLSITDTTEWHYIAVAFDPSTDRIMFILDEEIVFATTSFEAVANSGPLTIGGHFNLAGGLDNSFDGYIDELRITRGVLRPSQLLAVVPVPAPAALPAGLVMLGLLGTRRRHR
ncbi:LamG domain-containing protein [Planctomycetales bacterium ZRK34]|nr:LamG domain-containing protein [Planctomycetales bacterium ZRK34]